MTPQHHRRASEEGQEAARRFVRRLDSAHDQSQWPVLVRQWLRPASARADGADRLQGLLEATLEGWGRPGWVAFARVFCGSELGQGLTGDLFSRASESGFVAVRALFLLDDLESGLSVHSSSIPPDDLLGSLPLGVRKARARQPDPVVIERLSLDSDPTVIRILLDNPRLTEVVVVRVCARRPHRAEALAEVARSKRWLPRRDVQRALALNPFSPARVAAVLLPLMSAGDRHAVRQDKGTHPAVVEVAKVCAALLA